MVSVAILTSDQRLSFQIHTWLKEMADVLQWETHSDLAAFETKIETEVAADLISGANKKDEDAPLDAEDIGSGKSAERKDAFYRLLIVDLDLIQSNGGHAAKWANKIKTLMIDRQRSDPLLPVRVIFLAFEGGGFKIDSLRDAAVDDVILKPLDKSVLLQKIEILTADDPKKVKPTFLFRQKTNITIEIGKDAQVEEISEFGVAILNPAPLAAGVFASIHCSVFGPGDMARMIGRVYKSEPHPTRSGAYLVRFGYFGLRTEQLERLKKYVRTNRPAQSAKAPAPSMSSNDPSVPFNRVAVIDMNTDIAREIGSSLRDHYVGVTMTHYLSYARLLATLQTFYQVVPVTGSEAVSITAATAAPAPAPAAADSAAAQPAAAVAEPVAVEEAIRSWTMPGALVVVVSAETRDLLKFESPVAVTDTVFGRTQSEWMSRPGDFFSGLEKQHASELQEMISYSVSGGKGHTFLKMTDVAKRVFFIEAHATLSRAADAGVDAQVSVELKQIDKAEYLKLTHAEEARIVPADLHYDIIYIDVNLIRGDLQPWYDGLCEAYMKAGVIAPSEPMPKVVLLSDEKSRVQPQQYRAKAVTDFIFKPLDRKLISSKANAVVPELVLRKEPDIAPFIKAELQVKIAKDAQMEELSEYGLSIAQPSRFKEGAIMRFFSPLLGGSADGVLARCTYCEQKQEKEVSFLCHFMFFGVPDEILKRIRNWIREDYVSRKEAP